MNSASTSVTNGDNDLFQFDEDSLIKDMKKTSKFRRGHGTKVYENGDVYKGDLFNGMRHGIGTQNTRHSKQITSVYSGGWKDSRREGDGEEEWTVLRESNIDDQTRDSKKYNRKKLYVGQFKHDQFHGRGYLKAYEGSHYVGEFCRGRKCGFGFKLFPSGEFYEGSWLNDTYDGWGVYHYSDGRVYKGYWKNGLRDGKGIMEDKLEEYNGNWLKGMRHGEGMLITYKGSSRKGLWKNDNLLEWTDKQHLFGTSERLCNVPGKMPINKNVTRMEKYKKLKETAIFGLAFRHHHAVIRDSKIFN